ncbi:MAG: OB-fold nucleic acid binding domain-containing protein [Methanothrix sp.]
MDEQVEEIYRQVADQITPEDFQARVEEKVALMAGLCDGRTAAMLVARDLGASEVLTKIGSIRPETGNVTFTGRVLAVSEIREFPRSDGSMGRVANLTLADETGSVRVALWDETVELVRSGDLKVDQCLKVRGLAKEGYAGTEVSLGRSGGIEEVDLDILPRQRPIKLRRSRATWARSAFWVWSWIQARSESSCVKTEAEGKCAQCFWETRRARSGLPSGMSRRQCCSRRARQSRS